MTRVTVTELEPGHFGVQVREGTVTTSHKVAVSDQLVDDLGLVDVDRAAMVEETFAFLLEREPASAIRGDFPLDEVARWFPEFLTELKTRLGAPPA